MKKLFDFIQKAQHSKLYLWLLNRVMNKAVPFNKPHGFQVVQITPTQVTTVALYQKKNFNHVRGIHACAIATVGELAAGLVLMANFSGKDYRFIMSRIEIDYHYQAKQDIIAIATLSATDKKTILDTLSNEPKTLYTVTTEIHDKASTAIATVKTTWQIKRWNAVRTNV